MPGTATEALHLFIKRYISCYYHETGVALFGAKSIHNIKFSIIATLPDDYNNPGLVCRIMSQSCDITSIIPALNLTIITVIIITDMTSITTTR